MHPHHQLTHTPRHQTSYMHTPFPAWAIVLHLILTLGTCFCWTPIWIIHYLLHPKTTTIHTYG